MIKAWSHPFPGNGAPKPRIVADISRAWEMDLLDKVCQVGTDGGMS